MSSFKRYYSKYCWSYLTFSDRSPVLLKGQKIPAMLSALMTNVGTMMTQTKYVDLRVIENVYHTCL
jgi:hypothetical protein